MNLKIRYDNHFQNIELDAQATDELMVSLSINAKGLTQEEKEQLIQSTWDERFNKPEYNSLHKFDRHRGTSLSQLGDDHGDIETSEPLIDEVIDKRVFFKDEIEREAKADYEETCNKVREKCGKKTEWAELFIRIELDGYSIKDYADKLGKDPSGVGKMLKRVKKFLKKYGKMSDF